MRERQLAEGTPQYATAGTARARSSPALVSDGAWRAARLAGDEPTLWALGLFIFDNAFEGAAGVMQGLAAQLGGGAPPPPQPSSLEQQGSVTPTGGGDTTSASTSSSPQGSRSSSG